MKKRIIGLQIILSLQISFCGTIPNIKATFKDTELKEVISLLARTGGLNFSIDYESIPAKKIDFSWNGDPIEGVIRLVADNNICVTQKDGHWFFGENKIRKLGKYSLKYINLKPLQDIVLEKDKDDEKKEEKTNGQFDFLREELLKVDKEGKVTYDVVSNTLVVNTTEQGQKWVECYLNVIDKEVPNIELKIMFLASSEEPTKQLGFDWNGSLSDGLAIKAGDSESGLPIKKISSAILSTDALTTKLRLYESTSETNTKKYPSVTTIPGQAVVLDFTRNEPVINTTSSTNVETSTTSVGKGTTDTVDVKQEKVGTQIVIFPVLTGEKRLFLDTDISVSNIIGYKTLRQDQYPIISRTNYRGRSYIDSGHTLIIGGLEETSVEDSSNGVNGLNKIPLLGWLFRSKAQSVKSKKLSLYISVRLLDAEGKEIGKSETLSNEKRTLEEHVEAKIQQTYKEITCGAQ